MAALLCKYTSNASEQKEFLEPQKTDRRDPKQQFTALTFPKTIATQLKAVFAWTALKIPLRWRFHRLSRPSVPEFHSSCFGGSI